MRKKLTQLMEIHSTQVKNFINSKLEYLFKSNSIQCKFRIFNKNIHYRIHTLQHIDRRKTSILMKNTQEHLICLFSLLFALSASAAEESNKALKSPSDNSQSEQNTEELRQLDEIEAAGYRFVLPTLETPFNTSLITRKDILESSATNLAEVLQKEGELMFQNADGNSSSGNIAMRGFGYNSQSRVLVLVDGQKINPADMAAIDWTQIPLENIENIEIIKGAQTARYGSAAEAGVIKITTLKGLKKRSAHLRGIYGTYGLYNVAGGIAGQEATDTFYSLNLKMFNDDGWRAHSKTWNNSVNASVGQYFSENLMAEVSGGYSENYLESPGALTWSQYDENPRQEGSWLPEYKGKHGIVNALVKYQNDKMQALIRGGAFMRDTDCHVDSQWGNTNNNTKLWNASFTPYIEFAPKDEIMVFGGVDLAFDNAEFRAYSDDAMSKLKGKGDASRNSYGIYIGSDYTPQERLTFSAIGRYEGADTSASCNDDYYGTPINYDDSVWQNGWAAEFSVNYKLTENTSAFFRFDQIYHYATLDEMAQYQGYYTGNPFNPNLKAEHGQNYEIGVKYQDENWSAILNFFLTELNDEITYVDTLGNINLDPTSRCGVDFKLSYDDKFWGASFGANVVRAKFREGEFKSNYVPLVPSYTLNATVYVKPIENLRLLARARYLGNMYQGADFENVGRQIPSYAILDLQAVYKVCDYFEIFGAIENVTDKKYVSTATYSTWGDSVYPGQGRIFKIGVNIRY